MKFFFDYLKKSGGISRMQPIIMFLIIILSFGQTNLFAQETQISLDINNSPLKEVFKNIESQSNYSIFYSDDLVKDKTVASFHAKDASALAILDRLLTKFNLSYKLNGNIIAIVEDPTSNEVVTITGKVIDNEGLSIPGVNVYFKGTTNGTVANVDGEFSVEGGHKGDTLIASSIGFSNEEIVIGEKTVLNIMLKPDVTEFSEVVVTALGITKEKKTLGYSVSDLDGEELTTVKDANIINSLSGKSAGVMISKSAGGPDASTRVVIRGNNSLQGNNQPLYVVDGIPISNDNFGQTTATSDGVSVGQGFEMGSGIGDINPEDIESVSILKGPNAAALYGSRAANGVIVFTTKKGAKQKGLGISLSSNTTFNVANIQRKYQDVYGFGNNGTASTNDDGLMVFPEQIEGSWGAKMEGQPFIDWDGETRNYDPQPDNYKDFFRVGITSTNTATFSGGNTTTRYRFSFTDMENRGITPNTSLKRRTVTLRAGTDLGEKLKLDSKINYINNQAKNRNYQADGHSVSRNYIHMPRSVSDASLRSYEDEDGNQKVWREHSRQSNPYWVAYKDYNGDNRNRVLGNVSLTYEITPWLTAMGRTGIDFYYNKAKQIIATGELTNTGSDGKLYDARIFSKVMNNDFLFSANKEINEHFNVSGTFGGSTYYSFYESMSGRTTRSSTPNFYNIQYSKDNIVAWTRESEKKSRSLYGSAQIGYNNYLFLDITARNDWSSTLPEDNNSYFYPSITGSFLFSDFFNMDKRILSFGKLRASWAEVGSDTDPYKLENVYYSNGNYNSQPLVYVSKRLAAVDLKPEITESYEIGGEIKFFMDRLGFDITYYSSTTRNQILDADIAPSSGSTSAVINAGEIENKGWEIQMNANPINRPNGFSWNMTLNYAKNKSMVVSLTDGLESLVLANHWNMTIEANPGEAYGNLVGVAIKRDEDGNKLVGSNGLYERGERQVLGNYNPDWIGGMSNYFTYKRFSASFQIDAKIGGEIYSATNHYGCEKGTFVETLEGREGWYASEAAREAAGVTSSKWEATGGFLVDGVTEDGNQNTKYVNPESYWGQFASWGNEIHEKFIYDASYIKLREVSLGYKFPKEIYKKLKLQSLDIAFTARNLCILYKKAPNIDPESVYNSTNAQGVEYAAMPSTRSYGFNLKVSF